MFVPLGSNFTVMISVMCVLQGSNVNNVMIVGMYSVNVVMVEVMLAVVLAVMFAAMCTVNLVRFAVVFAIQDSNFNDVMIVSLGTVQIGTR